MDPNATYMEMFYAMRDGDLSSAREHAITLQEWFAKGGFYPYQVTKVAMDAYVNHVLRRTVGF